MKLRAQNKIVTGALLLLLLLMFGGAMLVAPPASADEVLKLPSSSPVGMATDHAHKRYWLLEKASGKLTLTAVNSDGKVEGKVTSRDSVTNAQALAFGGGKAYVGDIGGKRNQIVIYQVSAPWPGTNILKAVAYKLSYPDGSHDATALLIGPDQRLSVVTKGPKAGVYQASAQLTPGKTSKMTRVANAPDGVTDGVVLTDGRVVLRTAKQLFAFDAGFSKLGQASIDAQQRGQTVTQALEGPGVLVAASSGGVAQAVAVPGTPPSPSSTPHAPTPKPKASESPAVKHPGAASGMHLSIGIAAAVALVAALVVGLRRS